jgi:hypothetical protein
LMIDGKKITGSLGWNRLSYVLKLNISLFPFHFWNWSCRIIWISACLTKIIPSWLIVPPIRLKKMDEYDLRVSRIFK